MSYKSTYIAIQNTPIKFSTLFPQVIHNAFKSKVFCSVFLNRKSVYKSDILHLAVDSVNPEISYVNFVVTFTIVLFRWPYD